MFVVIDCFILINQNLTTMKTLFFCLLLVFVYSSSFSQKKNIEDPIYGESSKSIKPINKQNKYFNIETDEFTQTNKIFQIHELVLFQKGVEVIYSNLRKFDDQLICNFNFSMESYELLCVNSDSKVLIKLNNGNILTLKHMGEIECDKMITINTVLSPEDIKALSENQIEKIRCYTTEGYLDYTLFDYIPKNYWNKKYFANYVENNPKEVFQYLLNEIQKL